MGSCSYANGHRVPLSLGKSSGGILGPTGATAEGLLEASEDKGLLCGWAFPNDHGKRGRRQEVSECEGVEPSKERLWAMSHMHPCPQES